MRVLHVISGVDTALGGPAMALRGLVAAQQRLHSEIRVVSTYRNNEVSGADYYRKLGVKLTLIGPAWTKLGLASGLREALRREIEWSEVVHIHTVWEQVQHEAAWLAQSLDRPYILRPCGMLDPWSLRHHRLYKEISLRLRTREMLRHAALIHAASDVEAENLRALSFGPEVVVEPNGIDLRDFNPMPPRGYLTARFPQLVGRQVVLFLGRVHYQKGIELLIPAFSSIAADRPTVDLVVAGPCEPEYLRKLEQLIAHHNLADRVHFTGMLRDRDRVAAMADADLFVLPSYQENFGIAVVEAMASGLPVIVSDQVATCAEVQSAGAGSVIPLEVPAITAALNEWLDASELARQAGQAGRQWVLRKFSWHEIAQRWRPRYRTLLNGTDIHSSSAMAGRPGRG